MRFPPRFSGGFPDLRLNSLVQDILLCFGGIKDTNVYTFEVVWTVPFSLSVPTAGNKPRATSPDIVRCARAVAVATPTVPVLFGAAHWSWVGDNNVRVDNVAGLVAGTRYRVTFEVIG